MMTNPDHIAAMENLLRTDLVEMGPCAVAAAIGVETDDNLEAFRAILTHAQENQMPKLAADAKFVLDTVDTSETSSEMLQPLSSTY